MKKMIIILLFITTLNSYAQNQDKKECFEELEEMPVFPGRPDSLWCFLESNFKYDILNSSDDTTKYFIRFNIDTLGAVSDFKIIRTQAIPFQSNYTPKDSVVGQEILRVMKMMPKWKPYTIQNKKLNCGYVIVIITPYTKFKCLRKILET